MRTQDTGFRIQDSESTAEGFPVSRILNPESSKGFTLLEFIVVISLVAVLAGLFLSRIPFYQEQAEKTNMQQVEGALQSALTMRYGALLARGAASEKELGILATDNPMNWLQQKPKNYAGEYYGTTAKTVAPGHWMFDLKTRELIYVPDRSEYLTPGKDGQKWIRFHVNLGYETPLGGASGSKSKELTSALFEPVEPYRWLD